MKGRLTGAMLLLEMFLLVLLTGCGNLSPIASFTCTPSSGHSPLTVSFDASASYDPDGSIVSYQWTFGDGTNGTGVTISHTYTTTINRTYSVTLTVTDDSGAQATDTHTVSVTPPPPNSPPVASFSCAPTSGPCCIRFSFDASSSYDPDVSYGGIASYEWNFGDGDTDTGRYTLHRYDPVSSPKQFTVTLIVRDEDGMTANASHVVTVTPSLQILTWELVNDGSSWLPWSVVGQAKNVSGRQLDSAEVRARFYDSAGVLLYTDTDYTSDLPNNMVWEFKIRCWDDDVSDRIDHAQVEPGECYAW